MKNKVLLIRPNNLLALSHYPPFSLILIGSALEKAGYHVEIIAVSKHSNYLEVIKSKLSDELIFVGLTVLTTEVVDAIRISKHIKAFSNVPVVWGGWHVTLFPKQVAGASYVDYAVTGDGECAAIELANQLKNNHRISHKIISFPENIPMDDLPLANYSLVKEIDNFITMPLADKFQESFKYSLRWLPYQSSRGCPGQCNFCINMVTDNQRYRAKSAEKVVKELELLGAQYHINHFKIIDDNFFVLNDRVKKICELILERNLRFSWDGECRTDYFRDNFIDDDLLGLLKKSGLVQLVLGVESASPKTLRYLDKGADVDDATRAIKALNRHGIISDCSFIVGLPGETREDIMLTSRFINEHRKYDTFVCGVQTYRPYPKSKIASELIKENKLKEPATLEEWSNQENVRIYTYVDAYRPWIQDYSFSMNISYYQTLVSGIWLFDHQLVSPADKWINNLFKKIALFRIKHLFFLFPIDKKIYSLFRNKIYRRIERKKAEK